MNEGTSDPRFTLGLLVDLCEVLRRHGYERPADDTGARADTVTAALRLTQAYEGRDGGQS